MKLTAEKENWLDLAWAASAALEKLPRFPPGSDGGLLGRATNSNDLDTEWLLLRSIKASIQLHLAYRLRMKYKLKPKATSKDGDDIYLVDGDGKDPSATLKAYMRFVEKGANWSQAELFAIDAQAKLEAILWDQWICDEWRRLLPLVIASIGGTTVSQHAREISTVQRRGMASLREAKERIQLQESGLSNALILRRLQAEGVVRAWSLESIEWIDESGRERKTDYRTFCNWRLKKKNHASTLL